MKSSFLQFAVLLLLLPLLGACRELPVDRLYALRLERPPSAQDWERALPRQVVVRGGRLHEPKSIADIDEDTVHTTTASCHHGAALPEPVAVDMRAFYTDSELFLRLSWRDATRDDAMMQWRFDGEKWINGGGLEDGFGILWGLPSSGCSIACHIDDFGVSGAAFHASNKMKLAAGGPLDLWNWKAGRTGSYGFADDRYLDGEGMHGDVPGELYRENSAASKSARPAFNEGDAPLFAADGLPFGGGFLPAGTTAPGYLTERPVGGRGEVAAFSKYEEGRWVVVLRRRLDTGDRNDQPFLPGDEEGIAFGLSLMDNTLNEHYASVTRETIVLLR